MCRWSRQLSYELNVFDHELKGCDASLLLDGALSEKTAPPNLSVRGYDIIDQAKAVLEIVCPGVVSCADIIVAATRDAIALVSLPFRHRYDPTNSMPECLIGHHDKIQAGGSRYNIQTGRRDGKISLARNVDLPSPTIPIAQSIAAFQKKGLSVTDMVLLLGTNNIACYSQTVDDLLTATILYLQEATRSESRTAR